MNGDDEKNKTEFIPDFYREFIARIIPGLVVIALYLYWSATDFKVVFSTATISFLMLVAAWIIGVTLDVGVFLIVILIFPKLQKNPMETKPDKQQEKVIASGVNACLDEWEYLCNAKPWERGIINKTLAQVIFFRSMFSICALIVIFSVASMIEWPAKLKCWVPVLFEHNCFCLVFGLIFCLVFCLCWWQSRKHFFEHLTKLLDRQHKLRNKCPACGRVTIGNY